MSTGNPTAKFNLGDMVTIDDSAGLGSDRRLCKVIGRALSAFNNYVYVVRYDGCEFGIRAANICVPSSKLIEVLPEINSVEGYYLEEESLTLVSRCDNVRQETDNSDEERGGLGFL
jgi:hypothetical protein